MKDFKSDEKTVIYNKKCSLQILQTIWNKCRFSIQETVICFNYEDFAKATPDTEALHFPFFYRNQNGNFVNSDENNDDNNQNQIMDEEFVNGFNPAGGESVRCVASNERVHCFSRK